MHKSYFVRFVSRGVDAGKLAVCGLSLGLVLGTTACGATPFLPSASHQAGNTAVVGAPSSATTQSDCQPYVPSPVPTDTAVASNQDPTQVIVQFDENLVISAAAGRTTLSTGDCKLDAAVNQILLDYKATTVRSMAEGSASPTPTFRNTFLVILPQGADSRNLVALLKGLPHVTSAYISVNSSSG